MTKKSKRARRRARRRLTRLALYMEKLLDKPKAKRLPTAFRFGSSLPIYRDEIFALAKETLPLDSSITCIVDKMKSPGDELPLIWALK